jgi:phage gpG-like protein
MNELEFKRLNLLQKEMVRDYVYNRFPTIAGNIALRFIDGNFRAQGWQGSTFKAWKSTKRKGTILIKTGALRRGTYFTNVQGGIKVINNVKYAAVHNNGFQGVVQVKGYRRRIIAAKRVETGRLTKTGKMRMKTVHSLKGYSDVKPFSRKMNIPQRQFMPVSINDSPVLVNALRREIVREFQKIFK